MTTNISVPCPFCQQPEVEAMRIGNTGRFQYVHHSGNSDPNGRCEGSFEDVDAQLVSEKISPMSLMGSNMGNQLFKQS